jgi:hypothetical protein
MEWNVIPAEYDMPSQRGARIATRWLIGSLIVALIIGAGLVVRTGTERETSVGVRTSK